MKLPTSIPPEGPRQMMMAFDSVKTRGMSPRQREAALMALAMLLMEAACKRRRRRRMNAFSPLPPALLKRKAVVYVRQSSQSQVTQNLSRANGATTILWMLRASTVSDGSR